MPAKKTTATKITKPANISNPKHGDFLVPNRAVQFSKNAMSGLTTGVGRSTSRSIIPAVIRGVVRLAKNTTKNDLRYDEMIKTVTNPEETPTVDSKELVSSGKIDIKKITPAIVVAGGHVWIAMYPDPSDNTRVICFDCVPSVNCRITNPRVAILPDRPPILLSESIKNREQKGIGATTVDLHESYPGGTFGESVWWIPDVDDKTRTDLRLILHYLALKIITQDLFDFEFPSPTLAGIGRYALAKTTTDRNMRTQGERAAWGKCFDPAGKIETMSDTLRLIDNIRNGTCGTGVVCSTSALSVFRLALLTISPDLAVHLMGESISPNDCSPSDVFTLGYNNPGKWIRAKTILVYDDTNITNHPSYRIQSSTLITSEGFNLLPYARMRRTTDKEYNARTRDPTENVKDYYDLTTSQDFYYVLETVSKIFKYTDGLYASIYPKRSYPQPGSVGILETVVEELQEKMDEDGDVYLNLDERFSRKDLIEKIYDDDNTDEPINRADLISPQTLKEQKKVLEDIIVQTTLQNITDSSRFKNAKMFDFKTKKEIDILYYPNSLEGLVDWFKPLTYPFFEETPIPTTARTKPLVFEERPALIPGAVSSAVWDRPYVLPLGVNHVRQTFAAVITEDSLINPLIVV